MISLVFAIALLVSVWSMFATIRSHLPQIRALFVPGSALPPLPPRSRATVRTVPARMAAPARQPLRAAA